MGKGRSRGGRTSNDDWSDSMNRNNPAYQASLDNRSVQLNIEEEDEE